MDYTYIYIRWKMFVEDKVHRMSSVLEKIESEFRMLSHVAVILLLKATFVNNER